MLKQYIFKVTNLLGDIEYIAGTFETTAEALRYMNEDRSGLNFEHEHKDIEVLAVRFFDSALWDFDHWMYKDWRDSAGELALIAKVEGWA